jgi:hypothetical protein
MMTTAQTRISAYVMPSQCQQCVPAESHGYDVIEYAHETTCPNALRVIKALESLMEDGRGVVSHG